MNSTKDNIISIAIDTCIDINSYYRNSILPKFIKKHIALSKYKKLENSIDRYIASVSYTSKDTFYYYLSELISLDYKDRKNYNCIKVSWTNTDAIQFYFDFPLYGLDKNIAYRGQAYGQVNSLSRSDDIIITYSVVNDRHLIGEISEETDELIDSLVTLKPMEDNTLSYKLLYCQNYFAHMILNNIFNYVKDNIKRSKRVVIE